MRISDWSSDVCSSDLAVGLVEHQGAHAGQLQRLLRGELLDAARGADDHVRRVAQRGQLRAERNTAAQHRQLQVGDAGGQLAQLLADLVDRKSTRLNSSN